MPFELQSGTQLPCEREKEQTTQSYSQKYREVGNKILFNDFE